MGQSGLEHGSVCTPDVPGTPPVARLDSLWAETFGDPRVVIAVLDGQVDLTHRCFEGGRLQLVDVDQVSTRSANALTDHGTHVASVIFGRHCGSVRGIAPACSGLIIPVFRYARDGSAEPCSHETLAASIREAVRRGAHIINISGGELAPDGAASPELSAAVEECRGRALIVAAAGNDGCRCLHVPGALPAVLAVGAMRQDGEPSPFSNWGDAYRGNAVLAPGERIPGAKAGGGTSFATGTSVAAAIVSGVAGLLYSLCYKLGQRPPPEFIRDAILSTAIDCARQPAADCDRLLAGRLNVGDAMEYVKRGLGMTQRAVETDESRSIAVGSAGTTVGDASPVMQQAATREAARESAPFDRRVAPSAVAASGVDPSACECECGTGAAWNPQLVYAVGSLAYDFPSLAREDSIEQNLEAIRVLPNQPRARNAVDFLRHLCGFDEIRITMLRGEIQSFDRYVDPNGQPTPFLQVTTREHSPLGVDISPADNLREISFTGVRERRLGGDPEWKASPINSARLRVSTIPQGPHSVEPDRFFLKYPAPGYGFNPNIEYNFDGATWHIPQRCEVTARHRAHRYDARAVIWKLQRGQSHLYAIQPEGPYAAEAYDELIEFLLDHLGLTEDGLDFFYYEHHGQVIPWHETWDPRFNDVCGCPFESYPECCENYQSPNPQRRAPLLRGESRLDRVAVPGVITGQVRLLTGEMLSTINPDMRGTADWSADRLIHDITQRLAGQALLVDSAVIRRKAAELLSRLDEEIRNPGLLPADRALNFASTQLLAYVAAAAADLVIDNAAGGGRPSPSYELDDILPPQPSTVCRQNSDCWDVEVSFFDPDNTYAARIVLAQSIDVSDVVPVVIDPVRRFRRR